MENRRISRSSWSRFAAWIALTLSVIVLARTTRLVELFDEATVAALADDLRGAAWVPLALIVLYGLLSPSGLPMSPLIAVGAAFGPLYGTIYNSVGLVLGAATSFLVARFMGRDVVVRFAGRRLRRVQRFLDRRGFWPLVQTRFLPVPFAVVNFASALAGVRLPLFLTAAVAGLVPSTLIHTYFIAELIEPPNGADRWTIGAAYLLAFVVLNTVLAVPSIREAARRRQRYGDLVAARASREDPSPR